MSTSTTAQLPPSLRAALYIRVSSEDQAKEGYSLIAQQEKLEDYAHKNGYQVDPPHVYIDDGYSGKTQHRPALARLFADAQQKVFDVVLVYRLDRFFRNVRLLLDSVETLGTSGVGLKSITEPFDTSTPIGRYVLTNLGAVAELERAIILERKELGTAKAAQAGKWMGGTPPYGYRLNRDTKKLEIDPQEAEVVQMLYTWLTEERLTLFQIQQRINALQIPTKADRLGRSKPTGSQGWWRKPTLARMVANETYAGTFWFRKYKDAGRAKTPANLRPQEDWVAIPVPALISRTQFERALAQLAENRKNAPRRTQNTYLFAKKLTCGLCGGVMVAQYYAPTTRRTVAIKLYTCHKRFKQHAPIPCTQKSLVEPRIAIPVWDTIARLLLHPEVMLHELAAYQQRDDPRPALEAEHAEIERQLHHLAAKRERVLDLYIEKAINKMEFLERSRKLEREQEILTKRSRELTQRLGTTEEWAAKATSLHQLYAQLGVSLDMADYETKRQVIAGLVRRIVVYPDRLDVECHLPATWGEALPPKPPALCHDPLAARDTKPTLCFSVTPLPLTSLAALRRHSASRSASLAGPRSP